MTSGTSIHAIAPATLESPRAPRPLWRRDGAPSTVTIAVDARMLFFSGIGRYLREVLSRWPAEDSRRETFLYNSDEQKDWLAASRPRAKVIRTEASVYSLREQMLPLQLPAASVYWVPHYNLPWHCGARLVATVHDAAPLVLKEAFPSRAQRLAAHFYFSNVRRKARRIIAVSHFTAGELIRHARVDPRSIAIVPNGVDDQWRGARNLEARDPRRLLFVGNLKSHKNLGRLLAAIELVRSRHKFDLTLDVVGQTHGFRAGLEAETARRLENSPWIRLHGKIGDDGLRTLYTEAGGLVFPSLYEGFGLPMLEAMAAGCPVVASSAGALPEIGGPDQCDGGAVVYFDPRDSFNIARRLEHFVQLPAAELDRMGEAGRARAARYSWDTTAEQTLDVLLAEGRNMFPK